MGNFMNRVFSTIIWIWISYVTSESFLPEDKIVYLNPTSVNIPEEYNVQRAGRLVGGEEVKMHEFPGLVHLIIKVLLHRNEHTIYEECPGSIINSTWILCNAHCLNPTFGYIQNIWVTAGDHFRSIVEGTEQISTVKKYIVHGLFDPKTFVRDIGLLELSQELLLNEYVQIESIADETFPIPVGTQVVIAGWGRSGSSSTATDELRKAKRTTLSHLICELRYEDEGFIIGDKICAVGPETGGCTADHGGLMYCTNKDAKDTLFVCGVKSLSLEDNCGSALIPVAYTDIRIYMHWIKGYVPSVKTTGHITPTTDPITPLLDYNRASDVNEFSNILSIFVLIFDNCCKMKSGFLVWEFSNLIQHINVQGPSLFGI